MTRRTPDTCSHCGAPGYRIVDHRGDGSVRFERAVEQSVPQDVVLVPREIAETGTTTYPTQASVEAAEQRYAETGLTIDAEKAVAARRARQSHARFAEQIEELITLSLNAGGMKVRLDERERHGQRIDRSAHAGFMSAIAELREALILADAEANTKP